MRVEGLLQAPVEADRRVGEGERQVRLLHFEDGRIEFQPAASAPPGLANEIGKKLSLWTNRRWVCAVVSGEGPPTLHELAEEEKASKMRGVAAHPHVQAVLERFPGAEIVGVRAPAAAGEEPSGAEPPPEDEE